MKKTLLAIAITATTFSGIATAAVPNVFSNGTPADATLVNENFTDLDTKITNLSTSGIAGPKGDKGDPGINGTNGIDGVDGINGTNGVDGVDGINGTNGVDGLDAPAPTTYSYKNYGHAFNTKTFTVTDTSTGSTARDKELRTFTRPAGQVVFTRDRTLAGTTVEYHTITLNNTGPLLFEKYEVHDIANTSTITETRTMVPGVLSRTENMEVGKVFGSASKLTSSTAGISGVIQSGSLMAANQNITVNSVPYTDCISTSRTRVSTKLGNFSVVDTYCANVGLVSRLELRGYVTSAGTKIAQRSILTELEMCNGATCVQ